MATRVQFLLALVFVLSPCGVQAGVSPVVEALRTHREYLHDLAVGRQEPWLAALTAGPLSDDMCANDREGAVSTAARAGAAAWGIYAATGFIEDETCTRLVAAGVLDEAKSVRDEACKMLNEAGKDGFMPLFADAIKQAVARLPPWCGPQLLGRIPITLAEAKSALGRPLPPEVRARLGDTEAEAQLIARFENARDYDDKAKAAGLLGYVKSRACGTALVRALNSPMEKRDGQGFRESIRYRIIRALGRIHEEELMLTWEIHEIYGIGDYSYGGPEAIQAYLRRVNDWARQTYGVEPVGPEPPPFLWDASQIKLLRH